MATSPDGLFEMNDTHIEQFYRDGYFVAPRLIDRETVENVIDDFESQGETVDPSGEWKATGFTHFSSHAETYPRVAQFLQSERLVDMIECLFRSPARLWLGMYAVVRPKGGRGLAWHQDNHPHIGAGTQRLYCAGYHHRKKCRALDCAPISPSGTAAQYQRRGGPPPRSRSGKRAALSGYGARRCCVFSQGDPTSQR